jgi:glycosyltransferase involved in cell wall biosynthesis
VTNRKIVFALVGNPGTNDARVMKEARALHDAGYKVAIFGRTGRGFRKTEDQAGIAVRRFDCFSFRGVRKEMITEVTAAVGLDPIHVARLDEAFAKRSRLAPLAWVGVRVAYRVGLVRRWWTTLTATYLKRRGNRGKPKAAGGQPGGREPGWLERLQRELTEMMFYCRYFVFAANLGRLRFEETPDIIHAHDIYTLPGAVVLARRFGAKLVYDAHEIESERVPPMSPDKKGFVDAVELGCLASVDELITVSRGCRDFYSERFDDPKIVMNAPPVARVVPTRNIRSMLKFGPDVPLVVYTGGIGREFRGLDKVAVALALLPGVHLAVMGPRQAPNDIWLLEIAAAAGVSYRIHLLPSVPADEVTAVVATADLAICPIQDASLSYRHSMPNKLFEAAFAGLPICVSNLPDMRDFVEELGLGVVMDQTDPASIADAIREVLENRERYTGVDDLRDRLAAKYSWQSQAAKLVDIYAGLAKPAVAIP